MCMENKEKKDNLPSIIIAIGAIIGGFLIFGGNSNQANGPEQTKCGASAQKAYELLKEKNSGENFPEIDGTKANKKDETVAIDFKYNYNSQLSLCFVEYVISMQATTIDTNETIQGNTKMVTALVSDITKQQTLAAFIKTSYPTGSQKISGCMVQTSGNYDDLNQKPIKDLFSPTQCKSESEFDSLVFDRFGIK